MRRRVAIFLAGFVLLVVTATGLLLTTGYGLKLAIKVLGAMTAQPVTIEAYSGSLLRGFEIDGLNIPGQDRDIKVGKLKANLDVGGLLNGAVDIKYLYMNDIGILNKKPPAGFPIQPRELLPPLRIKVDDFQAVNLRISDPGGTGGITVKKLALSFSLKNEVLKLNDARLEMEKVNLAGKGRVDFSIPLTIDVAGSGEFQLPQGPQVTGNISLKGTSRTLDAIVRVDNPFDGSLELVVHDLLNEPSWTGRADLNEIRPALWYKQLAGLTLGATLNIKGDLTRAGVDGILEVSYDGAVDTGGAAKPFKAVLDITADGVLNGPGYEVHSRLAWDRLVIPSDKNKRFLNLPSGDFALHAINSEFNFHSRSSFVLDNKLQGAWELEGKGDDHSLNLTRWLVQLDKGSITAAGNVDWSEETPKGDFNISWKDLAYPLDGAEPAVNADGDLSVAGSVRDYALHGHGIFRTRDWPVIDLKVNGSGNNDTMRFNPITLSVLNGKISGTGKLALSDPLLLDMAWRGADLNPGGQWRDWPGKLAVTAVTRVKRENERYQVAFHDFVLSGTLRNYPVRLAADAELAEDSIVVHRLKLASASSTLDISGRLAPDYDVKWQMAVPDLGNLLPHAAGSLAGQGEMSGLRDQPRLAATLRGNEVRTPWFKFDAVASDVDLDFMQNHTIDLSMDISGLAFEQRQLGDIRFQATGSQSSHVYTLDAGAGAASLQVSGKGSFAGGNWDGSLDKLLFKHAEFGRWRNTKPIGAYYHADEKGIRESCLKNQKSSLCFSGAWSDGGNWTGRLAATDMPINLLDRLYPENMRVNGSFNLDLNGKREQGKAISATGNLVLAPGELLFAIKQDTDEKIAYRSGYAAFQLHDAVAETDMVLNLEEPGVQPFKAAFVISGLKTLPVDPAAVSINGTVSGAIEDLGFTSSLTPYLADVAGRADLNLKLKGHLIHPDVSGVMQLIGVEFLVPDLGIEIKNMDIDGKTTAEGKFALQGQFQSGEGTTRIQATLSEDAKGVPVIHSHLEGERFEVINLPELWALASPDVVLKLAGDSGNLKGKVLVSNAVIDLDEIAATATTSLSSDVVLTGQKSAKTESATPGKIDTVLEVEFGDDLKVKGKGITGNIKGKLQIISGKGNELLGNGEIRIENGQFSAYGQSLSIEEGKLIYRKAKLDNPELSIKAVRHIGDVTAGVNVAGYITNPVVTVFSSPVMSDDEALSYVVFGRPLSNLSTGEGTDLIGAATSLGLQNSGFITKSLSTKLGIDTLQVESNGSATDASLVIGKYLTPKLYLSYGIGLFQSLSTAKLRYDISRRWQLEAEHGAEMGADVLYKIDK